MAPNMISRRPVNEPVQWRLSRGAAPEVASSKLGESFLLGCSLARARKVGEKWPPRLLSGRMKRLDKARRPPKGQSWAASEWPAERPTCTH